MKNKFAKNEPVKTETAWGLVTASATFPSHTEYLVEFPDGTASWIHEEKLSPVAFAKSTATPNSK